MSTVRNPSVPNRTEPGPPAVREAGTDSVGVRERALAGLPEIDRPTEVSTGDAQTVSTALFARLESLEEGTPEHAYVRNTLVELNLSLVKFAARRFRNRAEPTEDIIQVGTIGLIKAIDRFETGREVEFSAFALPTIVGEMKRFFRDTSWAVQVPRRLQELRIELAKAIDTLEQRLGRRPTRAELAAHLHLDEESVAEGEQASNGYVARSLDTPTGDDETSVSAGARRLGSEEHAFEVIDALESLKPLIAGLDTRDRRILALRFGEELTQAEIGERLGLSQMHISRLLARILDELRTGLLEDAPEQPVG
ncbi:SigB/SigF/SigG family RNA polymerase sigma factor [Streptomyces sp. NPDC090127]|uniref:SigB/SigF/SigG family RNA polymerase sigma factor n=1 Tax=Streptomyces sp. NPDC090127 TaxID=3365953 RepID=UPI0037FFB715